MSQLSLSSLWDALGYVASALVIATFCMKAMVPLRVLALCSNVAFLTYGLGLGLTPVYMLHGILLPMNAWRLQQAIVHRRCARGSNRSYG